MSDELPPLGPELEGLFSAAREDLPAATAKAKARAALGLPAAAPAPATPQAPASAGLTPPGAGAVTTAGVGATTVVKGLLVLGLAGGAYVLGVRVGDGRAREELAAVPLKTVVVEKVVEKVVERVVTVPTVAPAVDAGTLKATRPSGQAPDTDDLTAELALLDAARKALTAKDAAQALGALTKYDAAFPRGSMKSDAQLLRLEALLLAGRRAEAETLGKKLSSTTDSELVRERVRRLLDAR